jgi:hypothetical protein
LGKDLFFGRGDDWAVFFGGAVGTFLGAVIGIGEDLAEPDAVGLAGLNSGTGLADFGIGDIRAAADGIGAGAEVLGVGFETEGRVPTVGMDDGFGGVGFWGEEGWEGDTADEPPDAGVGLVSEGRLEVVELTGESLSSVTTSPVVDPGLAADVEIGADTGLEGAVSRDFEGGFGLFLGVELAVSVGEGVDVGLGEGFGLVVTGEGSGGELVTGVGLVVTAGEGSAEGLDVVDGTDVGVLAMAGEASEPEVAVAGDEASGVGLVAGGDSGAELFVREGLAVVEVEVGSGLVADADSDVELGVGAGLATVKGAGVGLAAVVGEGSGTGLTAGEGSDAGAGLAVVVGAGSGLVAGEGAGNGLGVAVGAEVVSKSFLQDPS